MLTVSDYQYILIFVSDFYHERLKPIMANWAYLWLQKQHLYGIESGETIRYLLEGPAARSETSKKILLLEAAIANKRAILERQPSLHLPLAEERYLKQSLTASVKQMNLVEL